MADDAFPPVPFDFAYSKFREHDAWVRQDADTLNAIYQGKDTFATATHMVNGRPYRGGAFGLLSKMFLGQPIVNNEKRMFSMPPLAGDICTLSAALLYGEAPTFRYPKPEIAPAAESSAEGARPKKWRHPAQDTLDLIMGSDQAHAELLKSGEYAAALGGTFIAAVWDPEVRKNVFPRAYRSDCALPVFRYGELVSCTLWSEFRTADTSHVFRLLERHEKGLITYTLHRGSDKVLGPMVPMSDLPETSYYNTLRTDAEWDAAMENPSILNGPVTVATGVPEALTVVYIPNRFPNHNWDKLGTLANLGRSDLDGIEDMLDKYAQILTSLMRDVENGEGRLTVPESWLEQGPRGQGSTFDPRRQVYVGVSALGKGDEGMKDQIVSTQFEIRVEEHDHAMDVIKRQIAERTGYSPAHLGIRDAATGTKTATEITADFTDSERTRDTKAMLAKPALAKFAQVAVALQGVVFGTPGAKWYDELPDIEFTPISQQDMEKLARIASAGYLSNSMSLRQRVKTLHPDWDDEQIDDEVEALELELGSPAPDPTRFTDDDTDPKGERQPAEVVN